MDTYLDPILSHDLLKGRSEMLASEDQPQSIQDRLLAAAKSLEEAVAEARQAIAASPATPLFEAKLAEGASVPSASIQVKDDGTLVVVYSVAESAEEIDTEDAGVLKPLKSRSKRKSTKTESLSDLSNELEKMLASSTSGYRGLSLPRMREIAALLQLDIAGLGRQKISFYEALMATIQQKEKGSEVGTPSFRVRTGDPQPVRILSKDAPTDTE